MVGNEAIYPWLQNQWSQWQQLQDRLGHAYLLSGPKGIGLEDFALQIAQAVLCKHVVAGKACGQCQSCHLFQTQQHPDFFHLARLEDKKEIGVDQVRGLIGKLNETSHQGGYKVTWVEGIEYLNQSAFNALLKTLEEPTSRTLFLLTTHQIGRLPATIKSRCQKLDFPTPALADALIWLQKALPLMDEKQLKRALRLNWGAPLDAKRWIENGQFEEDAQWREGLKQIQTGRKTVSQVVSQWLKWSKPESVFDYFYVWTVAAIRATSYSTEASDALQNQSAQLQNWLRFQQAILQAKQSWAGNANKELVLEALCIEWLEIQQTDAPLQSVFQSRLQRGRFA